MRIAFWFEFASTYSYLSAARIAALACGRGVVVEWTPFLLGPIFAAQGWGDSPFNLYPAKGRYMWRDMQRRCAARGLAFVRPSRFPRNGLLAARVALAATATQRADGGSGSATGAGPGWLPAYVHQVFHANFALDREIGEAAVIGEILDSLGQPSAPLLAAASQPAIKERLRARTGEAQRLGLFGAPSFVVGEELFWGDDRLEDALAWAEAARD